MLQVCLTPTQDREVEAKRQASKLHRKFNRRKRSALDEELLSSDQVDETYDKSRCTTARFIKLKVKPFTSTLKNSVWRNGQISSQIMLRENSGRKPTILTPTPFLVIQILHRLTVSQHTLCNVPCIRHKVTTENCHVVRLGIFKLLHLNIDLHTSYIMHKLQMTNEVTLNNKIQPSYQVKFI